MDKETDLSPDIREVVRYLGYHGIVPDDNIREQIEQCIRDLLDSDFHTLSCVRAWVKVIHLTRKHFHPFQILL